MADRCFAAVWPPAELTEMLRALDRPPRPGLRWTTEEQWHVTLRFYPDVDPSELAAAMSAAELPRAVASAGPRPSRLFPAVWALPVSGLDRLAGATPVLSSPARPFRGHLTLARARDPAALGGLPCPLLAFTWPVAEVTAVRSRLRPEGARYEVLDRWSVA